MSAHCLYILGVGAHPICPSIFLQWPIISPACPHLSPHVPRESPSFLKRVSDRIQTWKLILWPSYNLGFRSRLWKKNCGFVFFHLTCVIMSCPAKCECDRSSQYIAVSATEESGLAVRVAVSCPAAWADLHVVACPACKNRYNSLSVSLSVSSRMHHRT